jgi:hypothetical protein
MKLGSGLGQRFLVNHSGESSQLVYHHAHPACYL